MSEGKQAMSENSPRMVSDDDIDPEVCGKQVDTGAICGRPAVSWVTLRGNDWRGNQASACAEHRDELLAFPGVRASSDAPILVDEVEP